MANEDEHGLGDRKSQWGHSARGKYTEEDGMLAYYEICNEGYTIVQDEKVKAPYGYKGKDWVGFDDPASLVYKAKHLVKGMCDEFDLFSFLTGLFFQKATLSR